jgi:hypothetical protein
MPKKLLAAFVPLLAVSLAVVPATASATKVTPAATEITATNVGNTAFIWGNAYVEASIQCKKSTLKFTTPTEAAGSVDNTNQIGVGIRSTGSGSVTMKTTQETFSECAVYNWIGNAWVEGPSKTVTTASGHWTVAATNNSSGSTSGGALAIALPPSAFSMVVAGTCTYTVSPEEASSVDSGYTNATSRAVVDGQMDFSSAPAGEACTSPVPGPAQFEATYALSGGFKIIN